MKDNLIEEWLIFTSVAAKLIGFNDNWKLNTVNKEKMLVLKQNEIDFYFFGLQLFPSVTVLLW